MPIGKAIATSATAAATLVMALGFGVGVSVADTAPTATFGLSAGLDGVTTLEQDHFTYALPAGDEVLDSVEVINFQATPITVRLYAADLLTAEGGALTPAQAGSTPTSAGGWILLGRDRVTVPALSEARVPFLVSVPSSVGPGEYLGAVVGSTVLDQATDGLGTEVRVALQARVRVPGIVEPGLAVDQPIPLDADRFEVVVHNTGNVLLTVDGVLKIEDRAVTLSPEGIYIIPGGEARFTATWSDRPLFGVRTIHASFSAFNDDAAPLGPFRSLGLQMVFVPWFWLGILLAAAATASIILIRIHRISQRKDVAP